MMHLVLLVLLWTASRAIQILQIGLYFPFATKYKIFHVFLGMKVYRLQTNKGTR